MIYAQGLTPQDCLHIEDVCERDDFVGCECTTAGNGRPVSNSSTFKMKNIHDGEGLGASSLNSSIFMSYNMFGGNC